MASRTMLVHDRGSRQQALDAIGALPDGQRYSVTIEPYSPTRSLSANAAYWAGTICPAAEQLGYDSSDDLHEQVCMELYGWHEIGFGEHKQRKPNRTTTCPQKMTKQEFRAHMERAAALLVEHGVALPAFGTWSA